MALSKYIQNVCKIGQGHECCRYLLMGPKGFECAKAVDDGPVQMLEDKMKKRTPFKSAKEILDWRAQMGLMTARGDNCEGKDPIPEE